MTAAWFDQLAGRWRLKRCIVNLSGTMRDAITANAADGGSGPIVSSLAGRMAGVATFTRIDATSMAYEEVGELVLREGTRLKAVRRYTYRLEAEGVCIIEFADGPEQGRRFLRFSSALSDDVAHAAAPGAMARSSWTVADEHLCGRDLYQAAYSFDGFASTGGAKPMMRQRTVVSGPRKDYAIVSRLMR